VVGAATTLGAGTVFRGNIVSFQAITVGAGSTIDGRALSVTAAVTLDSDTINWCDATDPTITAPANVTASTGPADTSCSAFVSDATLGTATATDNSTGTIAITRGPVPAGNLFPVGTTGITYTARDPSDNTASATQLVTIADGTPPTITSVPANASYQFLSGVPAALATNSIAMDNCGTPTRSVLDSDNGGAGTPASPLIITRTFTATDAAGNSASRAQTITVSAPAATPTPTPTATPTPTSNPTATPTPLATATASLTAPPPGTSAPAQSAAATLAPIASIASIGSPTSRPIPTAAPTAAGAAPQIVTLPSTSGVTVLSQSEIVRFGALLILLSVLVLTVALVGRPTST
jgi:Ice-binding-like/HYR domain